MLTNLVTISGKKSDQSKPQMIIVEQCVEEIKKKRKRTHFDIVGIVIAEN